MKYVNLIFFFGIFQNVYSQFRLQIEGSGVTRNTRIENYGYIPSFYQLRKNPVSGVVNFSLGYQFKNRFGINFGMSHISTINKEIFYLDALDINYRLYHRSTTVSALEPQIMFDYSFDLFGIDNIRIEIGADLPMQKMRTYLWTTNIDYLDPFGEVITMSLEKSTKASNNKIIRPRLNLGKQFKLKDSEKHNIYIALT